MAEQQQRCGEGHLLCINNCGFFGSPATRGLCSKCYSDDHRMKEEQASSSKIITLLPPTTAYTVDLAGDSTAVAVNAVPKPAPAPEGRCSVCRKRVGLTGFMCRCGSTYCGSHRYPEQHQCGFNYKADGRHGIATANPLVKRNKLLNKI